MNFDEIIPFTKATMREIGCEQYQIDELEVDVRDLEFSSWT